jgi:hypothetical protein
MAHHSGSMGYRCSPLITTLPACPCADGPRNSTEGTAGRTAVHLSVPHRSPRLSLVHMEGSSCRCVTEKLPRRRRSLNLGGRSREEGVTTASRTALLVIEQSALTVSLENRVRAARPDGARSAIHTYGLLGSHCFRVGVREHLARTGPPRSPHVSYDLLLQEVLWPPGPLPLLRLRAPARAADGSCLGGPRRSAAADGGGQHPREVAPPVPVSGLCLHHRVHARLQVRAAARAFHRKAPVHCRTRFL